MTIPYIIAIPCVAPLRSMVIVLGNSLKGNCAWCAGCPQTAPAGTRGGLRGFWEGMTDQSLEAASDLLFITNTPHWHLTVCESGC